MEDTAILQLYFARDEQAIVETGRKYGGYCYSVAYRVLNSGDDAEEVVNDTYLNTWNVIPPQRPAHFKQFLAKITRNLAFSRWRRTSAAKRGGGETALVLEELAECIPGRERVEERLEANDLTDSITRFLKRLPERDRAMFLLRYFYVREPAEIAVRMGIPRSTVHVVLSRIRAKLRIHLTQEGYDV